MVMDLVIWPATLVLVVFPKKLFRRELFLLGTFQSGTTSGFKRVPRDGAAGRVAEAGGRQKLGVGVMERESAVSPWRATCVRSLEMQQHEVWTSPEQVV